MKTMKKLLFSVCAATLLLFSACSKDDDKNVSEMSVTEMNSMIIGTWRFDHEEWWDSFGDQGNSYDDGGGTDYENIRLTFNKDDTYIYLIEGGRETGTYWITNDKELILQENAPYPYTSTTSTFIVETLTKTDLIVFEERPIGGNDWEKIRSYYKKIN